MTEFFGLLNDNGTETKFRIFIDLDASEEYVTDFYMNDTRSDAIMNGNKCTIHHHRTNDWLGIDYLCKVFFDTDTNGVTYKINIYQYDNEVLITGKEDGNFCLSCIPIFSRPIFFVATNKIEI